MDGKGKGRKNGINLVVRAVSGKGKDNVRQGRKEWNILDS